MVPRPTTNQGEQMNIQEDALSFATYATLLEDAKAITIPHAMLAWRMNTTKLAPLSPVSSALLAIVIAQSTGGDPRAAAELAWNAAQTVNRGLSDAYSCPV